MKISELMLGDIITFKDSIEMDETPIPVKVIALGYQHHGNENEALVKIGGNETCDIVTIDDDFVGYPLTAEILEKNFKKKTFYGIYDDYFDLEIREYNDSVYVVIFHNCEINTPDQQVTFSFVHELQHFLNHCGIENEIKL